MKRSLTLLVLLLSIQMGFSQEKPTSFSLQEAINYALEHNYSAINAERDIEDAQKQKWETIASGLPQVNGAISYQNQLKQPVSLIPGELAGGTPGSFIPVVFGQKQSTSATATLSQQIFDGSYIVGVQATKTFIDYSANSKEKNALDVRKAVVEAYGNVLLAEESAAILEKNKTALEKNLNETQKIFENGLTEEESVEQLQITLASITNQLKNAIRLKKITVQMLNLVMGLELDNPTKLTEDLDILTEKQIDFNLVESDLVLENNVDYKMALNLNEQRALELKLEKSKALPTLNAFVNFGYTAYSQEFDFLKKETDWFNSSILGFDLNIPIFSSLRRSASTQRAKIALEKAKTQKTEAEESLRLSWENAKSEYILAIEQYQTNKDNLGLAERIEKKNQVKYFEGLATSFELRQAQTQLYAVQQEYLQSMVDVINKKTALELILNN
ncbi:TolC family protein [Cellulophaga lytica]|uniref:Outer membrane efflux protein n=1 Tax=Cellulophaga lytica (strain ATCC 23178 / DSM 7489 / JCM 8516 / NBRC 14961 / NCIMB 1423 / VKM B-1433 / Cy l20) TaxID=867900 RepID=F0RAU8_CELLC|nr:TolC family protein [Cellulophaga lytica]ADY29504.1 outer membrane efflux protein [Cellulophaga lytica DSM 7489]WQG76322.1 TolC family protein [Cellulophaga lytica]